MDTDRSPALAPDRPRTTTTTTAAVRVAAFVATMALIVAVGWQVGRMVAPDPATPAALAGASAEDHDQHGGEQRQAPSRQHHHGSGGLQLWAIQSAALGTITLDGAGRIVYRSDADGNNPPVSRCTGECAQRWVPVTLPDGQEPDLLGIKPEHVGTFRREDGALQVTLAGWPLYTVAGDRGAHDDTGVNGAEGLWFAVTPTGEKVTP